MSVPKQFYDLKKISGEVKLSKHDVVKEVRSVLSIRKESLITDMEYGISKIEDLLSYTFDLNYIIPMLSISLREDIERSTNALVRNINIERDKSSPRALNIYISYTGKYDNSLRVSQLNVR